MRGRLACRIVLLAVLVQILTPIAAFRVVANMVSDPLYMASICSGMVSSHDTPQPVAPDARHMNCCAYCGIVHGSAVAVDPPALVFVTLQRDYERVSWLVASDPTPAAWVRLNARARAPPSIS